mmetsp:Transcript_47224/g.93161  ORF Transcript_47224/g.93161 Transcript_47224/m.93161 type:complete len:224 (-) Transcript_47224:196-867(-)
MRFASPESLLISYFFCSSLCSTNAVLTRCLYLWNLFSAETSRGPTRGTAAWSSKFGDGRVKAIDRMASSRWAGARSRRLTRSRMKNVFSRSLRASCSNSISILWRVHCTSSRRFSFLFSNSSVVSPLFSTSTGTRERRPSGSRIRTSSASTVSPPSFLFHFHTGAPVASSNSTKSSAFVRILYVFSSVSCVASKRIVAAVLMTGSTTEFTAWTSSSSRSVGSL